MKFSPKQLMDVANISAETYRHWKRVLPPFQGRNGRSPCFSVGDLVASATISRLTDKAGVRVGQLADIAQDIFDLFEQTPWAALENQLLVVHLETSACEFVKIDDQINIPDVSIVCPLNPMVIELRDTLLRSKQESNQGVLLFPPAEVTTNKRPTESASK